MSDDLETIAARARELADRAWQVWDDAGRPTVQVGARGARSIDPTFAAVLRAGAHLHEVRVRKPEGQPKGAASARDRRHGLRPVRSRPR